MAVTVSPLMMVVGSAIPVVLCIGLSVAVPCETSVELGEHPCESAVAPINAIIEYMYR